MKRIMVVVTLLLVAAEASAQERFDIDGMTCAEVQALLEREGKAILRYKSTSVLGLPLYDLYVSSQKHCEAGEVALRKGVPTTDKEYCPVYKCVESDIFVAR